MKVFAFILIFFCLNISNSSSALEDSLHKAIEISSHGSKFQSERFKVSAENIANEFSTSEQPGGNPYQRKIIFAENKYDKSLKTNVVVVKKFDVDKHTPFILRYEPNHPAADLNGYVKYPNMQREVERADASEAQRSYEANLNIMEMSKGMIDKTLEVMK